jgi:hypothetical protein
MAEQSFEQQLAAALAAVAGGVVGKSMGGNPQSNVPPDLTAMLHNSAQRQEYQNPLFQAVSKGTYDMLPTFAKSGTSMGDFHPTPAPLGGGGGGSGINGKGVAAGAGIGAAAAALGAPGAGGNLGKVFEAIKKLFGKGGGPGNYAMQPGTGFGGDHTTTIGGDNPWGDNLPSYDAFGPDTWSNGWDGMPNDPSGGTGVGPGMQAYYDSLNGGAGGTVTGTNWWEE